MAGREQKLIDILFQVGITAAQHLHGKTNEEIATWIAQELRECGFPTKPSGASWGVLLDPPPESGGKKESI